jgi:hypothetical protein
MEATSEGWSEKSITEHHGDNLRARCSLLLEGRACYLGSAAKIDMARSPWRLHIKYKRVL